MTDSNPSSLPCGGNWAPLLNWDDASLAIVAELVAGACRDWQLAWTGKHSLAGTLPPDVEAASCCAAAPGAASAAGIGLGADSADSARAAGAWLAPWPPRPASRFPAPSLVVGAQVMGEAPGAPAGSIAAELSEAAWDDLLRGLRGALGLVAAPAVFDAMDTAAPLPAGMLAPWSGAVRVGLPGFDGISLFLNGAAVARLLPPRQARDRAPKPALTTLLQAAQARVVDLQARLRGVELSIGQLASLQPGDVVILPHALDEPLQLVAATGETVCHAYLGRDGAHRAIEVLPHQPPAPV